MEELVRVAAGLLGVALVPLTGFGVVSLARRRPWVAVTVIGMVVVAGVAAVWHAAGLGYGYRPGLRRVVYDSDAARHWFTAGLILLTFGCPAGLLVIVARARNGGTVGPRGGQWVAVLFGYWLGCVVAGMALYSLLTGQIK